MEGFVAVTRCAVGVLCSLGRNDFFLQGGSIFPDARRPCPDRSSGCWVLVFPKGGLPDVGRKDASPGGVRETAAGASVFVQGEPMRLPGAAVPGPPRSVLVSRGRPAQFDRSREGGRAVCGRKTVARDGPFSRRFAWGRTACVGRTTAVRRRLQSWVAGLLRLRMSSVSVGNGLCRRERTESARRKIPGGKRFVRRAGLLREHPDSGRTFLFVVGFGLSVSRKRADFRSVSFRQGCGRKAARSMPAPKSAKSYRTGSSGSNVRSASVTSSTAFQSFCRRTSRPSSREVLPVWTSSGR